MGEAVTVGAAVWLLLMGLWLAHAAQRQHDALLWALMIVDALLCVLTGAAVLRWGLPAT